MSLTGADTWSTWGETGLEGFLVILVSVLYHPEHKYILSVFSRVAQVWWCVTWHAIPSRPLFLLTLHIKYRNTLYPSMLYKDQGVRLYHIKNVSCDWKSHNPVKYQPWIYWYFHKINCTKYYTSKTQCCIYVVLLNFTIHKLSNAAKSIKIWQVHPKVLWATVDPGKKILVLRKEGIQKLRRKWSFKGLRSATAL